MHLIMYTVYTEYLPIISTDAKSEIDESHTLALPLTASSPIDLMQYMLWL